jgi:hypothetical protein
MPLIEIRSPSARDLRWFGLILLIAALLGGGIMYWKVGSATGAVAVWATGIALAAIYNLVPPPVQRRLYMTWMYAAFPIGWLMSHLFLGAIFYGVLTPIGLLVRLLSHDPLQRQFDASASTYWIPREPRKSVDYYFKQF